MRYAIIIEKAGDNYSAYAPDLRLAGVILNAVLPGNDYRFGTDPVGDKSADLGSY